MTISTVLRYLILASVAYTADANRRYFGLPTTWMIHLTGNATALLLPDLLRLLDRVRPPGGPPGTPLDRLRLLLRTVVVDNPAYVGYVAPVALAYTVSHPRFNIYAGRWAERQILWFGPDTVPHASTAYSLTKMIHQFLASAPDVVPPQSGSGRWLRYLRRHPEQASGVALAALSAIYESAEFVIHEIELYQAKGDESKINMMWSVSDTATDLLSNLGGWAFATWQRRRSAASPKRLPATEWHPAPAGARP